jgi:DNA-binding HxlR family transcriptional regulator
MHILLHAGAPAGIRPCATPDLVTMQTMTGPRGNVRNERCGSRRVLDLVADKWAVIVIHVLSGGLERDGLVERKVYPEVPPRVEYTLSPLGETLVEPLSALCRWAEEHFREVERARGHVTGATL